MENKDKILLGIALTAGGLAAIIALRKKPPAWF